MEYWELVYPSLVKSGKTLDPRMQVKSATKKSTMGQQKYTQPKLGRCSAKTRMHKTESKATAVDKQSLDMCSENAGTSMIVA